MTSPLLLHFDHRFLTLGDRGHPPRCKSGPKYPLFLLRSLPQLGKGLRRTRHRPYSQILPKKNRLGLARSSIRCCLADSTPDLNCVKISPACPQYDRCVSPLPTQRLYSATHFSALITCFVPALTTCLPPSSFEAYFTIDGGPTGVWGSWIAYETL